MQLLEESYIDSKTGNVATKLEFNKKLGWVMVN